jgi:hypothetical protein
MQKLKFQTHLQHQIIPGKGLKMCKSCARLYINLTTVQQGCVTKKNNCYLFQKHDTLAGQNDEIQMLRYVVQIDTRV